MAKRSVADEVLALIPQRQPLAWYERAAPEHQQTLDEIRAAYDAGQFGHKVKPAAVAISKYLALHGIATVGFQGVRTWLERR
jgi:hypothetical protein